MRIASRKVIEIKAFNVKNIVFLLCVLSLLWHRFSVIRRESAARKELFEVDAALDDVLDVQVVVEQVAQDAVDSRALLGGKMDGYAVAFCVDGDAKLFFDFRIRFWAKFATCT